MQAVTEKVFKQNDRATTDASNQHSSASDNNNGWFKRKRLAEFHPLTEEDADLLQLRSNREFNLSFINQLLLKLAEQYPDHHFCNKKVVMNYMTKALIHELRESRKVNCSNFRFKSHDPEKLKSQYLEKIERNLSTSKQVQLKRKIAGSFEQDTAYELLTSCEFVKAAGDQYQLKLIKDISLTDHIKAKILEQVQVVYGNKINQLQIIPFTQSVVQKQENKTEDDQTYLSELNKLDPDSVWYKVRCSLIKNHGKHTDSSTFSKLEVVVEDSINKKIILKPTTAFIDYWVRQRHMQDLQLAFQVQGFTFELVEMDKNG
ncbi:MULTISPECIES: hypothetical protein [spotted fever group]|uniref:hypothetical protein n=1 Tax=spotted fever group TaxID=114277 RepID=UPI0001A60492|nr:hypothetical protein [Rickettsia endosymbiont of Ixodes scapularis]EER22264.1 hypothetical protein REIS_1478 [Rickettsia endosymbiont of Ixodes scapularis]